MTERNSIDTKNVHSMSNTGKIAAIVVPITLIVLGTMKLECSHLSSGRSHLFVLGLIISGVIYSRRRRLRAKKIGNLIVPKYSGTLPEKPALDLSAQGSQGTFLVALPKSSQDVMGQDTRIGLVSDKPRVLYVAPGEDPSSAPLKKGNEGSQNIPALKINTSALAPPTIHGQASSPSHSPRTAASKSPVGYSTTLSTNSSPSGKPYRLVIADSTFPPSLSDELEIQVGEHLYLIEEYEDEWCLVQRVGSQEKGVVPRLCVVEKDRTPSTKTKNVFLFSAQAITASKA